MGSNESFEDSEVDADRKSGQVFRFVDLCKRLLPASDSKNCANLIYSANIWTPGCGKKIDNTYAVILNILLCMAQFKLFSCLLLFYDCLSHSVQKGSYCGSGSPNKVRMSLERKFP